MSDLRVATRKSRLARSQADWVASELSRHHPGIELEIVEISTTGDVDRTSPVTTLTEVGAFVRAVQHAVLDDRADVAVHSCKDLPVVGPAGLTKTFPVREEPWDVLCGYDLGSLPEGALVGTGSPRRASQLSLLRPDVIIQDLRGNVDTRLGKVESGELDAVILAEAGLRRIGLEDAIGHRFGLDEMVPAAAQAVLAVETVTGSDAATLVAAIDSPPARRAVEAERSLLALTRAGCRSALGAYAEADGHSIVLTAFVDDDDGPRTGSVESTEPLDAASQMQQRLGL